MKRLKIGLLIINVLLIVRSVYIKSYLQSVGLTLILLYCLWMLFKWKRKRNLKNNLIKRTHLGGDLVLLCFGILLFRMVQIQIFNKSNYVEAINDQVIISKKNSGERGSIYDSNGKKIVYNINMYDLIIDPRSFIKSEKNKIALKKLLEEKYLVGNYEEILKNIENLGKIGRQYLRVNKFIDDREKKEIQQILAEEKIVRNVFYFDGRKERSYYKKDLYFFLLGNIGYRKDGKEKEGIFGLELFYEKYLKGEKLERRTPSIRSLEVGLPTTEAEINLDLDGKNLHLTIDNDFQYILNDEVQKQFESVQAEEAYAVIMDPSNGKVLATSFFTRNSANVSNPVFQFQLEPGSILKPVIIAAGINEGYITPETKFDIGNGSLVRHRHTIKESSRSMKGIYTTEEVLKKSSNIGMVLIGDEFSNEKFDEYLRLFGFDEKTGVDYPYEKKTTLTPFKRWDGLKKSTMAFGQGIVVTPIQMITAFSSLINGGKLYRPYIVDKITDRDGAVVRRNLPNVRREVITKETSETMKKMLEEAVEGGTVINAHVPGYRIGGKTGTAQFSENGRYVKDEYLSSAIGFFPVENPKYAILIMMFKPQGEKWYHKSGGTAVAPVLGRVIRRIISLKNIYSENIKNIYSNSKVKSENERIFMESFEKIPNLKNLTAREVLSIFKDIENIKVEIEGTGTVYEQEPKEGESIENIEKIKVWLK